MCQDYAALAGSRSTLERIAGIGRLWNNHKGNRIVL
jgi:hypothetical protein